MVQPLREQKPLAKENLAALPVLATASWRPRPGRQDAGQPSAGRLMPGLDARGEGGRGELIDRIGQRLGVGGGFARPFRL